MIAEALIVGAANNDLAGEDDSDDSADDRPAPLPAADPCLVCPLEDPCGACVGFGPAACRENASHVMARCESSVPAGTRRAR